MGKASRKRRRGRAGRAAETGASRHERRDAARRERREEEARLAAATRRKERARRLVTWGAVAAVVLGGGYLLFRPGPEVAGVEKPVDRGRGHVSTPVSYDSATPTSGPHSPAAPECRAYSSALPLEQAVHALEHGVVVVWYRADREQQLAGPLESLLTSYDSHVIVSPNEEITAPIVATAWNRLKIYQQPEAAKEFIETYRERGPERVDCDIS